MYWLFVAAKMIDIEENEIIRNWNPAKGLLVSIDCTAYNHENYIKDALNGFLSQRTDFGFEVLIHDDCSTDRTKEIIQDYVKKFPTIIKPIYQTENQFSKGGSISAGFQFPRAGGKYIAICEGDDFWTDTDKLQKQIDFLEQNENCVLVHTGFEIRNSTDGSLIRAFENIQYKSGFIQKEIFEGTVKIGTLTTCFRKKYLNEIPFDKFKELDFPIGDWPLWIFLSKYGTIDYLPISTAVYRMGHTSVTNPKSIEELFMRYQREKVMYKFICDTFPETCIYKESDLNYMNLNLLSKSYKMKDYKNANRFGRLITERSIYVFCSKSKFLFFGYLYIKNLFQKVKELYNSNK